MFLGFPAGSYGKESACNAGDRVWLLGWEDPLEEGMATHSSILAWRIPCQAPLLMGSQRVGHNWETNSFALHYILFPNFLPPILLLKSSIFLSRLIEYNFSCLHCFQTMFNLTIFSQNSFQKPSYLLEKQKFLSTSDLLSSKNPSLLVSLFFAHYKIHLTWLQHFGRHLWDVKDEGNADFQRNWL